MSKTIQEEHTNY